MILETVRHGNRFAAMNKSDLMLYHHLHIRLKSSCNYHEHHHENKSSFCHKSNLYFLVDMAAVGGGEGGGRRLLRLPQKGELAAT